MNSRNKSVRRRDTGHDHPATHTGSGGGEIEAGLTRLTEMTMQDLRAEWQSVYRSEPPPRLSRDLLIRGVAWKIQERAYGGLSQSTKRRLRTLDEQLAAGKGVAMASRITLKPGARLVREWRGQVHTVTVGHDEFEYDGRRWRSLSQIAKVITGVQWSGPRFFGLIWANGKVNSLARLTQGDLSAPGE